MKKLYLLLLAMIVSIGVAQAQNKVTIEWDTPGAVKICLTSASATPETLAPDQTSYTYDSGTMGRYIYALPNDGYAITEASYVNGSKNGNVPVSSYNGGVGVMTSNYNYKGGTITLKTAKLEPAEFTIDVEGGLDAIKKAYLSNSNTQLDLQQGEHSYTFYPAKDNKLTIEIKNQSDNEFFTITRNGAPVDWNTSYRCFYPELAAGDKFVIKYAKQAEMCTVDFNIDGAGTECIASVFDRSTLSNLTVTNNQVVVEKGHIIAVSFKDGYTVKSAKVTGDKTNLDFPSAQGGFNFTVDENVVVGIDVVKEVYTNIPLTVYATSPEGVRLAAGGFVNGQILELTGGTPVTEAIELPVGKYSDGSGNDPAVTIAAGTCYKFELEVSSKFADSGISVISNDGYYVSTSRLANKRTIAEAPISVQAGTLYIVVSKVENNATAETYVTSGSNQIKIVSSRVYGANITDILPQGYSDYKFDRTYQAPFTVAPVGNAIAGMAVYLIKPGVTPVLSKNAWSDQVKVDENGVWSNIALSDGDVLKVFADGKSHTRAAVNFTGTHAKVTYDNILAHTDLSQPIQAFDGTIVSVKPEEGYAVYVDGQALTPGTDGVCTFTTTGVATNVTITHKDVAVPVILPQGDQPVESLGEFIVSFPYALKAERAQGHSDDEASLSAGQTWANSSVTCEPVVGAEVPTFKLVFTPEPTLNAVYNLFIEEGYFTVDGSIPSQLVDNTYTLESKEEITWMATPTGAVNASEWPMVGFMFPDKSVAKGENFDYIYIEFLAKGQGSGTELSASDYDLMIEGEYYAIMPHEEFWKEGSLMVYLPEGALSLSGKPSPEISWNWQFRIPGEYKIEVNPDSGSDVNGLGSITVTIHGATFAEYFTQAAINLKSSYNPILSTQINYSQIGTVTEVEGADEPTFVITFDPQPTVSGDYSLILPYGAFRIDGFTNSDMITKDYNLVSGVEDIVIDADTDKAVYNLQGVLMQCEWDELPAGFYIRGGKVVKK